MVSIKGGRAAGRGGRAGTATGPAGTFGPGDAPQAGHCPDRGDADRGGHGRLPDAGTTCQAIAALLAGKRDLTVVTNDFYVVTSLLDRPEIQTIHTGGVVDVSSGSSSGRLATRTIGAINIDLCFLSTGAWSVSRGVTSPALDKVELKQEVMSRSSERVLVADSTKYGSFTTYAVTALADLDVVITDDGLAERTRQSIGELDVELRIATLQE